MDLCVCLTSSVSSLLMQDSCCYRLCVLPHACVTLQFWENVQNIPLKVWKTQSVTVKLWFNLFLVYSFPKTFHKQVLALPIKTFPLGFTKMHCPYLKTSLGSVEGMSWLCTARQSSFHTQIRHHMSSHKAALCLLLLWIGKVLIICVSVVINSY